MFPWEALGGRPLGAKMLGKLSVQLVSKISTYVILILQRYRQTDGRHAIATSQDRDLHYNAFARDGASKRMQINILAEGKHLSF